VGALSFFASFEKANNLFLILYKKLFTWFNNNIIYNKHFKY